MRTRSTLAFALIAALAGGQALAQTPGKKGPAPGPGGGPGMKPGGGPPPQVLERVRERVRTMRMWKLTEVLSLDEATAAKLFPLLKAYDDKMEPVIKDMMEAHKQLRDANKAGKLDDKTATTLVERLLADRKQMQAMEDQRIADVRKVLSPQQQAKLLIAMPRIDQMVGGAIRRAMRGKGMGGMGGPGMGGPGMRGGKGGPGMGPGGPGMGGGGPMGGGWDDDDDE